MNKQTNRYYLQQFKGHQFRHGGVGYVDAEIILEKNGYKPIILPAAGFKGLLWIQRLRVMLKLLFIIPAQSTVVFIFPVYAKMDRLLLKLLKKKGVRLICLLADIDGMKDDDAGLLDREIRQLRGYREFIVHNANMLTWLLINHPEARAVELGLFDFLVTSMPGQRTKANRIVFAGALAKSGFLLQLEQLTTLHFNIYGPGIPEKVTDFTNCSYKGVFDPYELPGIIQGSFGLVWDGDGLAKPAGSYGRYMSMISQHKLSLYIVSSLPVIIHHSAACAHFVRSNNIGLVISDLHEASEKIIALPEESYQLMQNNMIPLAARIRAGQNLLDALGKLGI